MAAHVAGGLHLFQVQRRHRLRTLHSLCTLVVTSSYIAVCISTSCYEYFNITGMVSRNVGFLSVVLFLHLMTLEVMAHAENATQRQHLDVGLSRGSGTIPEESLSVIHHRPGRATEIVETAAKPATCDTPGSDTVSPTTPTEGAPLTAGHQPASLATRNQPDAIDVTSSSAPSSPQRHHVAVNGTKSIQITDTPSTRVMITSEEHVTDIFDDVTDSNGHVVMTWCGGGDDDKSGRDVSVENASLCWLMIERLLEMLRQWRAVYCAVDVVKAVCCLNVFRQLLLYLTLYYWSLDLLQYITIFVPCFLVIVLEVSVTVSGFLL